MCIVFGKLVIRFGKHDRLLKSIRLLKESNEVLAKIMDKISIMEWLYYGHEWWSNWKVLTSSLSREINDVFHLNLVLFCLFINRTCMFQVCCFRDVMQVFWLSIRILKLIYGTFYAIKFINHPKSRFLLMKWMNECSWKYSNLANGLYHRFVKRPTWIYTWVCVVGIWQPISSSNQIQKSYSTIRHWILIKLPFEFLHYTARNTQVFFASLPSFIHSSLSPFVCNIFFSFPFMLFLGFYFFYDTRYH